MCEDLPRFISSEEMLKHLGEFHHLKEISIDADGAAWISETTVQVPS
jgi:hypothetical protein